MSQKTVSSTNTELDHDYYGMERLVAERIRAFTSLSRPLFRTEVTQAAEKVEVKDFMRQWSKDKGPDTEGKRNVLWNAYLGSIPEEYRSHYNCRACQFFIERFGGLVYLSPLGFPEAVVWGAINTHSSLVPPYFADTFRRLENLVTRSRVTGVFVNTERVWGKPQTGTWTHLSGESIGEVYSSTVKSAFEVEAEKKQDFIMLKKALADYPAALVEQAVRLLKSEQLAASVKVLHIAEWFLAVHKDTYGQGQWTHNILWVKVAAAPPGYCHIRSTMLGTLLDDLSSGIRSMIERRKSRRWRSFEAVKRAWAEKMDPTQYRRPTAAPSESTIDQAEKLVEKLGLAKSFERRFATLDEVQMIWKPDASMSVTPPESVGVFGALRKKANEVRQIDLPPSDMSWDRFVLEVLPLAVEVYAYVPYRAHLFGLVTSTHADAQPILQWDVPECGPRNPFSWYMYKNGSETAQWNLRPGTYVKVQGIGLNPPFWYDQNPVHQLKMAMIYLEGARDLNYKKSGMFFPESIRSELHGVRSVIEAYAREGVISGLETGNAFGLAVEDRKWGALDKFRLQVVMRGSAHLGRSTYNIDRWK